MNKHIALVLGTIFSVTILLIPFTGAFASSDSSVALPQFVFSLMFSSVSVGSTIDVTNYNAATGTSSSDNSVHLYNTAGSYSQINRQGINIAQNLLCLRYTIDNPSSGFFDDLIIEPYINGYPAHLYGTYTQSDYDNSITYFMFFYIGADTLRVKDSQGQDITPWGIRFTRTNDISYTWSFSSSSTSLYYYNYTLQSQTVDPGEAAELALDIINVLQLSQLSENLGMINTQLDTGNIASMMESMLTYLADIPDILTKINNIDTNTTNISSALTTFYNYYVNQRSVTYTNVPIRSFTYRTYSNGTYGNTSNFSDLSSNLYLNNDSWVIFSNQDNFTSSIGDFYIVQLPIGYNRSSMTPKYEVFYSLDNGGTPSMDKLYAPAYVFYTNNDPVIYIPYVELAGYYYLRIYIHIQYDVVNAASAQPWISPTHTPFIHNIQYTDRSILERIYLAIYRLVYPDTSVPSEIQLSADDINQNATTVNNFQSSTQQSLDQNLNDVPVVDYQIQATTGTQYMKAYSEALFNASNGFRIWYMLPLILFVIGMLIRWGVKK